MLTEIEGTTCSLVPRQRVYVARGIIARVDDVNWLQCHGAPYLRVSEVLAALLAQLTRMSPAPGRQYQGEWSERNLHNSLLELTSHFFSSTTKSERTDRW